LVASDLVELPEAGLLVANLVVSKAANLDNLLVALMVVLLVALKVANLIYLLVV
jgi:hypothetical protein